MELDKDIEKIDTPNSKEIDLPTFDYLGDIDKIDEELMCPICRNPYVSLSLHTKKNNILDSWSQRFWNVVNTRCVTNVWKIVGKFVLFVNRTPCHSRNQQWLL